MEAVTEYNLKLVSDESPSRSATCSLFAPEGTMKREYTLFATDASEAATRVVRYVLIDHRPLVEPTEADDDEGESIDDDEDDLADDEDDEIESGGLTSGSRDIGAQGV